MESPRNILCILVLSIFLLNFILLDCLKSEYFLQISDVDGGQVVSKMGNQARSEGIECMCWGGGDDGPEDFLLSGASSGVVSVWDVQVNIMLNTQCTFQDLPAHLHTMHLPDHTYNTPEE
jgi:hypothetical protein